LCCQLFRFGDLEGFKGADIGEGAQLVEREADAGFVAQGAAVLAGNVGDLGGGAAHACPPICQAGQFGQR
jgi:hypothetical protein